MLTTLLRPLLVTLAVIMLLAAVEFVILWLNGLASFGRRPESLAAVSLCRDGMSGAAISRGEIGQPSVRRIIAFDPGLRSPVRNLSDPESPPTAIARCSITGRIFVGCDDGCLLLYEGDDAAASPVLIGRHASADSNAPRVMQIVLSDDGQYLASEGGCNVIVWDLAARRHVQLRRDGQLLSGAAFIHPGTLMTGTNEGEFLLWSTATGRLLRRLTTGTAPILSIAASPTGDSLAATTEDSVVHVWDVATGIRRWSNTNSNSVQMVFTPDGGILAISPSLYVGNLLIYNTQTGSLIADLKPCREGINALVFAEDRSLHFCDNKGTLWTWDAAGTQRRWSFGSFLAARSDP